MKLLFIIYIYIHSSGRQDDMQELDDSAARPSVFLDVRPAITVSSLIDRARVNLGQIYITNFIYSLRDV